MTFLRMELQVLLAPDLDEAMALINVAKFESQHLSRTQAGMAVEHDPLDPVVELVRTDAVLRRLHGDKQQALLIGQKTAVHIRIVLQETDSPRWIPENVAMAFRKSE